MNESKAMLAACPFCAGTSSDDNACQMAKVETRAFKSAIGKTAYRVECGCGAAGPSDLVWGKANTAWNTRAPAPSAWQPIETAPLDRSVIVATDEGTVGEAHFEGPNWYWAGGDSSDAHDTECRYPRYWQPLPAAPSLPSSDRGGVG